MMQPPNSSDESNVTLHRPGESTADSRKQRFVKLARERAGQPPSDAEETSDDMQAETGSGRLEVRCPGCREPIEVAVDTTLTDIICTSCGSHFSLVDQEQATRSATPLSSIGRFELIERVGVGGFGSVWKARDRQLDRTVAVKVPRQRGISPEDQEKFFREARAAAQLHHANIVSVHEVGRDGDSIYIVSDFVRGVTLGDWLTGQQLTTREAVELCATIAEALHHAHEQGVVHRDLKPANIMIDGDGQPHLMDFGLARRDLGEVTVTMDGQILGTPAYMSPEQAAGEAHLADCRSDVYSLGVIFFQLLTSELPFRGNARMLVYQVINDPAPSPRKFSAHIPRDLETIVLKCLEKEPGRRYQSARELTEELRRYLGGAPIQSRPVGPIEKAVYWYLRNSDAVRITAAGYSIILSIVLLLWGTTGLVLMQTGLIEASVRARWELLFLVAAVYPTVLFSGWATLRDRKGGLVIGAIVAFLLNFAMLLTALRVNVGFLQMEIMSAAKKDLFFHFQLSILLFLLTLIGSVLYGFALALRLRHGDERDPSGDLSRR
ncbi:MAG: serine/threonine-protein kinase [Pirellulales bacterium]